MKSSSRKIVRYTRFADDMQRVDRCAGRERTIHQDLRMLSALRVEMNDSGCAGWNVSHARSWVELGSFGSGAAFRS